jgi:hypothetical protein
MEPTAINPPLDLLKLYKSREVRRISTFADVAGQLDPVSLASAYVRTRDSAPRRHEHNRRYIVDHSGSANRSDQSNRREEHLAIALWTGSRSGNSLAMPCGRSLDFLDYQTPLKAQQQDAGVGKVDLLGLIDGTRLAVIELKVRGNSGSMGDTPLHAYLEALAYCAIVEANTAEIAGEADDRFGASVHVQPPALVILAPLDFWNGYLEHSKTGDWWPVLSGLATAVDQSLSLETHFLGLRDVTFQMGTKGQDPQLTGDHSVFDVTELIGD